MKKEKWTANNIAGQEGKIVIVTGASSGIGYEAARVLANKNATVIIAVRNMEKGNKALKKVKSENKSAHVIIMELDLADLASVKQFADAFKETYSRLDLLINNAGVMIPPYSKTKDGFELQFGTNHLGHFALTGHLMDLLEATENSQIVNVASYAHKQGNLDFGDLQWEKRKYKPVKAYGDSKIANLYFTYELARRLQEKGSHIKVTAAHPGWTATDLQRHSRFIEFLNKFFAQTIEMGALPTLYAAFGEDVKSGDFTGPDGFMEMKGYPRVTKSNALSHDKEIAAKLWQVSEKLTGVIY